MSAAFNYAKALYDTIEGSSEMGSALERELSAFAQMLRDSGDLKAALRSPNLSLEDKQKIVRDIADRAKVSGAFVNFILLVLKKGRIENLSEISKEFRRIRLEASGGILGRLVSADPVGAEEMAELAQVFSKKLGKSVQFETSVNPELLAGIRVEVAGVTYDGSIRAQLNRLKKDFLSRVSAN